MCEVVNVQNIQMYVPADVPQGVAIGTHWIGCCVCPSTGLDDVERRLILLLSGIEVQPPGGPGHLRYDLYLPLLKLKCNVPQFDVTLLDATGEICAKSLMMIQMPQWFLYSEIH